MTIVHHPSDETLASYASGGLDAGRRLVVATHLGLCRRCHEAVGAFESVGGVMLDDVPPSALRPEALQRTLERLGAQDARARSIDMGNEALPPPLAACRLGPWKLRGWGVYLRSVDVPDAGDTRVFMLRAAPGTRLPHHTHESFEWTCVLQGAFRHQFGRYGPGDFDEAEGDVEHMPFVEHEGECICLVAMRGTILLQGRIGRMLQPFIRL